MILKRARHNTALPFIDYSLNQPILDIYDYIAYCDPYGARALINSFGYSLEFDPEDRDALSEGLATLVANEGEPALMKLAMMHPDRDFILETCGNAPQSAECSCGGKKRPAIEAYMEKAKDDISGPLQHGNLLFIGGVIILAVAIVATAAKKN